MKDLTIPKSWSDVKLHSYRKLVSIPEDLPEDRKNKRLLSALLNIPELKINDIPVKKFREIQESLQFISQLPSGQVLNTFTIEGVQYGLIPNLNDITLGEMIDLEEFVANWNRDLHKLMAILYRPVTRYNKYDDYEIEEYSSKSVEKRAAIFDEHCSVQQIYSTTVFFSSIATLSLIHTH